MTGRRAGIGIGVAVVILVILALGPFIFSEFFLNQNPDERLSGSGSPPSASRSSPDTAA